MQREDLVELSWEWPQAFILQLLYASREGRSATQLTDSLGFAPSETVNATLQSMNNAGWIETSSASDPAPVWKLSPGGAIRLQEEWTAAASDFRPTRELLSALLRNPNEVFKPETWPLPTLDSVLEPLDLRALLQRWNGGHSH